MKNTSFKNKALLTKCLFGGLLITLGACSDSFVTPSAPTGNTIVQVAASTDSLKAFSAAIAKTQLTGTFNNLNGGQFTVFAPSNYGFVKYLRTLGFNIPKTTTATAGDLAAGIINQLTVTSSPLSISALLTRMNYHIVSSQLSSTMITGPQVYVTMQGARLSLSKGGPYGYVLNANETYAVGKYFGANGIPFSASASDLDKTGSNGVIHLIDQVMTPVGTSSTPSYGSIPAFLNLTIDYTKLTTDPAFITIITSNKPNPSPNYDLMTNAMKKTQVITVVAPNQSPVHDFTLFVPDDASFLTFLENKYPAAGIVDEATAITFINGLNGSTTPTLSAFADLLKYHILDGRLLSLDIATTQSTIVSGHSLTYDGAAYTIKGDNNGSVISITSKDVLTNAGIVHVISGVLEHN